MPNDEWFIDQYRKGCSLGALAGAIRAVALFDRTWMRDVFSKPELWTRLRVEQPSDRSNPLDVAAWLQFFGASRLINPDLCLPAPDVVPDIEAALKQFPPGPPDEGIQSIQAGMWFGLKEWCAANGVQVEVSPALGEAILAQFRAAAPPKGSILADVNQQMLVWLEGCRLKDWNLSAEGVLRI